jgi:hypothetical protein
MKEEIKDLLNWTNDQILEMKRLRNISFDSEEKNEYDCQLIVFYAYKFKFERILEESAHENQRIDKSN